MHTGTQKAPEAPLSSMPPATRLRVEAAVLNVFSAQEFHKVKLADVAADANVSLKTIYKFYGSKENLLFESLDTWIGQLTARMIDHLKGIADFKERLRKVFWLILDYFEKNPKVAQLLMTSVHLSSLKHTDAFRQPELMALFMRVLREGRAQGVLTDEVNEAVVLDFIIGITERTALMWMIRGQEGSLSEQANTLFEMLWRAIANPAN